MNKQKNDISGTIQDLARSLAEGSSTGYPKEALPTGTWANSNRLSRLGLITDAFYGDKDVDGQNIIVYTLLLIPTRGGMSNFYKQDQQYYLTNEYEYEITAYLMMNPVDMSKLMIELGGELF